MNFDKDVNGTQKSDCDVNKWTFTSKFPPLHKNTLNWRQAEDMFRVMKFVRILPGHIKVVVRKAADSVRSAWQCTNDTSKANCVALVLTKFLAVFTNGRADCRSKEYGIPKFCLITCPNDELFIPIAASSHMPDMKVICDKVEEFVKALSPHDALFASVEVSDPKYADGSAGTVEQGIKPLKITHLDEEYAVAVGMMPPDAKWRLYHKKDKARQVASFALQNPKFAAAKYSVGNTEDYLVTRFHDYHFAELVKFIAISIVPQVAKTQYWLRVFHDL